jgi:aminoacrylate hydrolase
VTIDHRGAGRSGRPQGGYSIDRIARDAIAVLDAENIDRAHFVGHSTGGTVVQTIALDMPARAIGLVVSASWARPDTRFETLFSARLDLVEKREAAIYQKLTHVLGYSSEWIAAHSAELDAAVAKAAETMTPLSVTAARIRMLTKFDRSADLAKITLPTLIVGAPDDLMIPFDNAQELARLIPGSMLEQMSGGHFYPKTAPEPFASLVRTFLARVESVS